MRLICTITEQQHENPYEFSYYLTQQGIENKCEKVPSEEGFIFRIWAYEEDDFEIALNLYREYQANPHDPRYQAAHPHVFSAAKDELISHKSDIDKQEETHKKRRRLLSPAPYGPISIFILFVVAALFILAQVQKGITTPPKIEGVIQAPILSPVEKSLVYDYPAYFILRDKLLKIYSSEEAEQHKPLSAEMRKIIRKLERTPVWMGIYDQFLTHFRHSDYPLSYHGPMFEKISQGEVWRLFTPALLHFDLLHIFFNVLWFILLGNQIEFRLGWLKYLILILIIGVISNTAQYLVSGPFFMGLSGVVVGMAAFIWARQQMAPWEGYLLHRFTLIFLAIFVIGMFLLQIGLFVMQIMGTFSLSVGIANTAHLVGAAVGYSLGRLRLFAIHPKTSK